MRPWILAGLVASAGCSIDEAFVCQSDLQCGTQGQCQPDGLCSGPDTECPSGQRYFAQSGAVGGTCVAEAPAQGSTSDGPTTTSTGGTSTGTSTTGDETSSTTVSVDSAGSTSGPAVDTATGTTGGAVDDSGLVLWYPMDTLTDEGTLDASGNQLDASCSSEATCPVAGDGIDGGGALFDGVDDIVTVANDPMLDLPDGFSVMAWGRFSAVPTLTFSHLVAKPFGAASGNSFELFYREDAQATRFSTRVALTTVSAPTVAVPGQWFHIAATFDGQTLVLYIDGEEAASEVVDTGVAFDDSDMLIAADADAGELKNFFLGTIDDVRLYSRALDSQEIAELYEGAN